MKNIIHRLFHSLALLSIPWSAQAQVQQIVTYQGRITAANTNFHGLGQFKFALGDGTAARFWNNDGSTVANQPQNAVWVSVNNGLFTVGLGDTNLANMAPIPPTVFTNSDVRLRIWFSDGTGFQQLAPDQRITAVGYAMIAGNVHDGAITSTKIADGAITASKLAPGSINPSNFVPGGTLLFSDTRVNSNFTALGYQLVSQTMVGDIWTPRRVVNPTSERNSPTCVWTGQELILWGGWFYDGFQNNVYGDGGRYELATDTWRTLASAGAPTAREGHTAIWTGTEMIIWGGYNGSAFLNTGARYNPASNTWTPMSSANAPTARMNHSAVWTGTEMLIWGGSSNTTVNTGARYNPVNNTWSEITTNGAPTRRSIHLAFWTGTEMIIWGAATNTGARYSPVSNSWQPVSTVGAPPSRSVGLTGVWTGTEMIVWGGFNAIGGRYHPGSNTWSSLSTVGAPSVRAENAAVWTGTEMIIWGGLTPAIGDNTLNDGARYNPISNTWSPTTSSGAPAARSFPAAVWTGFEMLVSAGSYYDSGFAVPYEDTWTYVPGRAAYLFLKP